MQHATSVRIFDKNLRPESLHCVPPWDDEPPSAAHGTTHFQREKAMKHHPGPLADLKTVVTLCGVDGDWEELPNSVWRYKAKNRAGLNWSETKGTIWFDGPSGPKSQLEAAVLAATGAPPPAPTVKQNDKTIFVVHGHDHTAKEQLELTLHRLGLSPYVLQDSGGAGKTIVEALEGMIGKEPSSTFGIVLLTPDDVGHAKRDGETEAKPRARQNVILEMGMLLASLTRSRVAILQKGFVERPSDLDGVLYIPFNEHVKEAVPKLAQRLQEAGISLDASAIARASS